MLSFIVVLASVTVLTQPSNAQIPTACTDANSLENSICCPVIPNGGVCGEDSGRGACMYLEFENYDNQTSDVRVNWPHYYTRLCKCNDNFGGYDCSRCKFGYYGADCSNFQVLPRPPARDFNDDDWREFNSILRMTRTYSSGYSAVLEESVPGNASDVTVPLNIYEFYVWLHHYTAKDSADQVNPLDYSHQGPGFFTWHRLLNLGLEWQIQGMLQAMGRSDYHMFRLPYWDWRVEMQNSSIGLKSEELFSERRLGATRNVSGFPRVFGDFGDWDTICWLQPGEICDPRVTTGPLQRCPFIGTDPCSSSNPDWPNQKDVESALSMEIFDSPPYNILSTSGFRNFVDANVTTDVDTCREDRMCQCNPGGPFCPVEANPVVAIAFQMHARIHFIAGIGDVNNVFTLPETMQGHIQDVAASPNDPLFILHHLMIDCVLEEYLAKYPNTEYPTDPLIRDGHRIDDFIRGFYPVIKNRELFVPGRNFGYTCNLADIPDAAPHFISSPLLLLLSMLTAIAAYSFLGQ